MRYTTQILIFSRYPTPGQAKTRLIPALGSEGAALLHRRMTEHTVSVARDACKARAVNDWGITVCYTGALKQNFKTWLGPDLNYQLQPSGDLGDRLRRAFEIAFQNGVKSIIAVGTDVPGYTSKTFHQALKNLNNHDVALGPAIDGGYYLIGMKLFHPELFADIDWGTEHVYKQTCTIIKRLNLKLARLPQLSDVDRPNDLDIILKNPLFSDLLAEKPLISIVIPTLNEAASLGRTLDHLQPADTTETIVVDGGSRDKTCEIAAQAGARVLKVQGGRAAQQNAGAAIARGQLLLFLHADTLLPRGYDNLIRLALENPTTVAGAFRFKTDDPRIMMRMVEWMTNFRSTVLQWPYGDQGLFMEKRVFNELDGFPSMPIMEDFELVRRLRRRGTVVTISQTATTSSRRWKKLGIIRTTIINQLMVAGFIGGVSTQKLLRLYRLARAVDHKKTDQELTHIRGPR